ncbi:MAG: endonuclease MutS2 [Dehalococcoidia bacterium]|nr:MAG: endonuclease MutS2 [Dehalococcoidia bacterium]
MNDRVIRLLEFDKIRERLARFAAFSASRELALALQPEPTLPAAERAQQAAEDARTLLRLKPTFSIGGARDVRAPARQAALGGLVEPLALLDIAATLAAARQTRGLLTRLADQLPVLSEIASDLVDCSALEDEIARCIGRRGEVLDSASAPLARIRAELRAAHDQLRARLDHYLASPLGKTVLQEPIVTVREGRYVVPVKADFKGQVRGIVHDVSASGATVFLEPLEIVEMNNRWRELQLEEEREIERILRRISADVGDQAPAIVADVEILAAIDLELAKARYAEALHAVRPRLTPSSGTWRLDLRDARHPLLGERVVPISVELTSDEFVLVITGPNTGGKTVALKTVGLLTLMALAGMPIPAADGSTVPAFRGVAADIGDEQSIEQSLSTFSSHIGAIVDILRDASPATLVLLDELGAGTDPVEGSALARALLAHLVRRRIPTIATTHYSEVKVFAHTTPGVRNASVEFDPLTLAPTYRLVIGTPGASNALAIATRLGLAPEIIDEARALLSPTDAEIERLLADLQRERDALAAERQRVAEAAAAAEAERTRLADALATVERDRDRLVEEIRSEALREADELLRVLQRAAAVATERPSIQTVAEAAAELAAARQAFVRRVRRPSHPRRPPPRPRPLRVGDPVHLRRLGQTGELVALFPEREEAEVRLGAMKTRVPLRDLEPMSAQDAAREHRRAHQERRTTLPPLPNSPGVQLDLRGRRVDEVYEALDRYLNDAYLTGLSEVRVVHGKGTGALRQVVRTHLAAHPLVRDWAPAALTEGGEGATIAKLAV